MSAQDKKKKKKKCPIESPELLLTEDSDQSNQSRLWAHFRGPRMQKIFKRTTKKLVRLQSCAV